MQKRQEVTREKPPLGLIAGEGSLPRMVCQTAAQRGVGVAAVAFSDKSAKSLEGLAEVKKLGLGEAEKVVSYLKKKGCRKLCIIGKVDKKLVFENIKFDLRGLKMLGKLLSKDDSSIMRAVMEELEREGFEIERQTDWLPSLMPGAGVLGKTGPTASTRADFEFGIRVCRKMADMEIGQTILVKDGVVLAVEAVEGTDEAIERGCRLGGPGAVMIKAGRPKQDLRYDIPTVGVETVRRLRKHKAAALAIEAGSVVVVDLPDVISECDDAGMTFAAV
ncbi:MAG: UDP-2,3-diacylglucosamine diphosphatase LpxI [Nitrospinae bacterium]|nr:UDP-2,3-diacylglucosamine diphosphatase LpxI [Nitrospinota bacterium]